MTSLHLVRIALHPGALAAFAVTERVDDDDRGYAAHLALRRRFGAAAPQPFRLILEGRPHVLGYASDPAALMDAAGLPTLDDRLDRVFPEPPQAKPMPGTWRPGALFDFDVRVRPVLRYGPLARQARAAEGKPAAGERDVFLAAVERAGAGPVDRGAVYTEWFARQFGLAADLQRSRLVSTRRISTRRSPHRQPGSARIKGYEAVFAGTLAVSDPAAFTQLLRTGVGRHAAFGFGMLALAPARPG